MDRTSFPPIKSTKATRFKGRKQLLTFLEKRLSELGTINPDEFFEKRKQEFRKQEINDIDSIIMASKLLEKVIRTRTDFEEKISLLKSLISKEKSNTEA